MNIIRPFDKPIPNGYGLAFLLVFVLSSILIGSSFQFLSGPTTLNFVGGNSQNNQSAYNVALYGLEQMQTAIQTQLNANTAVTNTYTTSGSLTMPTDADQLIAGTTTVGSYTASVTNARGNAYTVSVTGTVGGASTTITRLLMMSRTVPVLDLFSPTYAYSLRRLRSAYTGNAIKIRRPSDNTEQDIGFTPSGELDIASILSFVSYTQQRPLDQVGGATAAFGLRKLRSAYAGSAIRVRRSSDNTEQDIGFNNDGDLDLDALFNFVSTGSGYIKTWYDQSGNGYNATQTTSTNQPLIVSSGALVKLYNGKPAIQFDGVSSPDEDYLTLTRAIQDDFSIIACFSLIDADYTSSTDRKWWRVSGLVDADTGGGSSLNDFGLSIGKDGSIYGGTGPAGTDTSAYITPRSNDTASPDNTGTLPGIRGDMVTHWAMFTRQKTTGTLTVYLDDWLDSVSACGTANRNCGTATSANTDSLNETAQIAIGQIQSDGTRSFAGYITEVIIYPSVLSTANRQTLQKNQGGYFHMEEMPLAFITTWYDQSGNGNHLTQGTNANQPALILQTGQRPAIAFNGENNQLQATNGLVSGNGARTLNVVMSPKFTLYPDCAVSSGYSHGWLGVRNGTFNANQAFEIAYSSCGLYAPYTYGSGNAVTSSPSLTNENSVITVVRNGSNTSTGYLNGTQVTTVTAAISTASGLTVGYMGASDSFPNRNNGRVSEIIGFSSNLSTANRTTLEEDQKSYYAVQQ